MAAGRGGRRGVTAAHTLVAITGGPPALTYVRGPLLVRFAVRSLHRRRPPFASGFADSGSSGQACRG